MSQVYEHNPGDHEDPLAGPTLTVGIIGTVFFVVTMLGVAALTYRVVTEEHVMKIETPEAPAAIAQLRDEQQARLAADARLERREENLGQDAIVIPIDRAIDLVVEEAGRERNAGRRGNQ